MSDLKTGAQEQDVMLKLMNVESAYGPIKAIRGVSLQVEKGQIATVLGSNGAGKTTTLRLVAALLVPDAGRVAVDGCSCAAKATWCCSATRWAG